MREAEAVLSKARAKQRAPLPTKLAREAIASIPKVLGARVRELRREADLTQAQLAAEVSELLPGDEKWHQTAVTKIENGSRPVKLQEAYALALVFRQASLLDVLSERRSDVEDFLLQQFVDTAAARDHWTKDLTLKAAREHFPEHAGALEAAFAELEESGPARQYQRMVDRTERLLDVLERGAPHDEVQKTASEVRAARRSTDASND